MWELLQSYFFSTVVTVNPCQKRQSLCTMFIWPGWTAQRKPAEQTNSEGRKDENLRKVGISVSLWKTTLLFTRHLYIFTCNNLHHVSKKGHIYATMLELFLFGPFQGRSKIPKLPSTRSLNEARKNYLRKCHLPVHVPQVRYNNEKHRAPGL